VALASIKLALSAQLGNIVYKKYSLAKRLIHKKEILKHYAWQILLYWKVKS